jgi:putative lipoprotein
MSEWLWRAADAARRSNRVIRALALALWFVAAPARADDWWGHDKALHFSVSIALGASGYGASSALLKPRWARAAVGGAFAIGVGGAKELWDIKHGDPSWRDFSWDIAGSAVGVGVAYLIDLALAHARHGASRSPLEANRAVGGLVGPRQVP